MDEYWAKLNQIRNRFLGDICNKLENPSVENCGNDTIIKEKGEFHGIIRLKTVVVDNGINFRYVLERP